MKYKEIENNILIAIGESKVIGENQTEITEEEYNNILHLYLEDMVTIYGKQM